MLMTRIITFKVSFTKEAIRGNMEMLAFYRRKPTRKPKADQKQQQLVICFQN